MNLSTPDSAGRQTATEIGLTKWFVFGMVSLAMLALAGHGAGLYSILGFNRERSVWAANQEKRDELIVQLRQLKEQAAEAQVQAQGAIARRDESVLGLAKASSQLDSVSARSSEAVDARFEAEAVTAQLEARATAAQKDIERVNQERARLEETIQQLSARHDALRAQVGELSAQKSGLEETWKQVREGRQQLDEIQADIRAAEKSRQEAASEKAKLESELELARRTVASSAAEQLRLVHLQNQSSALETKIQGQEQGVKELVERVIALREEKSGLLTDSTDLTERKRRLARDTDSELADRQQELRKVSAELATNTAIRDATASELFKLRNDVASLRQDQQTLQRDLPALRAERDKLESRYREQLGLTNAAMAETAVMMTELARAIADALRELRPSNKIESGEGDQ